MFSAASVYPAHTQDIDCDQYFKFLRTRKHIMGRLSCFVIDNILSLYIVRRHVKMGMHLDVMVFFSIDCLNLSIFVSTLPYFTGNMDLCWSGVLCTIAQNLYTACFYVFSLKYGELYRRVISRIRQLPWH